MLPCESIDKGLRILQRLGDAGSEGLALTRLARELEITKASVHRTLSALRHRGFVEQDEYGKYRIGPTLLTVSDSYLRAKHLRSLLHDAIAKLSADVNETCHLGVLAGEHVVYVDKVEPWRAVRTWSAIGWRNPALATALGRAMASQTFLDFESFSRRFPSPVPKRTPFSLGSLQEIWKEILLARQRGFAKEEQENEVGRSCVAVPVLRGTKPVAAVSITAPSDHIDEKLVVPLTNRLRESLEQNLPPELNLPRTAKSLRI